ncbi:hypothetical protein LINPERHAP2_LOCUS40958 [Linum perenne]
MSMGPHHQVHDIINRILTLFLHPNVDSMSLHKSPPLLLHQMRLKVSFVLLP